MVNGFIILLIIVLTVSWFLIKIKQNIVMIALYLIDKIEIEIEGTAVQFNE